MSGSFAIFAAIRLIFGEQLGGRPKLAETASHLSGVPLRRHC
jgi:hypothetical protein